MSEHHISLSRGLDAGRRPAGEFSRTQVLIVDDQPGVRTLCAGYCDLFDHAAETAGSRAEALAAMKRRRFDVVVMNVHADEGGALEAMRAIQALPEPAARTPVIGLAAPGRADEAQRWMAAGLAGVIAKPVTAARLFAAINAVLVPPEPGARSWARA